MLRDIDAVPFDVLDPTFGNRAVGIILGFGIGDFFYVFDAIDFEPKMVNAPRILFAVNQRQVEMTVGQINCAPRPAMLFFHAENSFVVFRSLVEVFDIDRDMSYAWFFHVHLHLNFYIGFSHSQEFTWSVSKSFPLLRWERIKVRVPNITIPCVAPPSLRSPSWGKEQQPERWMTYALLLQFSGSFSIARATPSRNKPKRSSDSLIASSAICSFSPVAYCSKNGRNMSLCSSSACECATKFGMSRHGIPMSSVQRLAMRVECPPPRSFNKRSSLVHSVTVSAASPSTQLLVCVNQAHA